MEKIFVSGGNGFIAGHTIMALKNMGYKVVTNVRSEPIIPYKQKILEDVQVYNVDSSNRAGIRNIIEKVDGVINLAGVLGTKNVKDWTSFYKNNVFNTWYLFEACLEFNVPIVQISVGNWFETNLYSNTKVAAERDLIMLARYSGLRGNVVRGLNAYGEGQRVRHTGKIIATFVTKALDNETLTVYGGEENSGIMDMIYVKDLADILVQVLEKTDNGELNAQIIEAGTGIGYSVYSIAQMIIRLTNSLSKIESVPMRSGETNKSHVVAQSPYPYKYTHLEEGLQKTIKYYKNALKHNTIE